MVYRTIKYNGQTLKKLEKVIKEIKDNEEILIYFNIETYEQYKK